MANISEKVYHEYVLDDLQDTFGSENVESERFLEETGRFCDIWIEAGPVVLACELENDWEAVIKGVSQALLYAQHDPRALPVVILPPGLVESPEKEMLENYVPIIEYGVDAASMN